MGGCLKGPTGPEIRAIERAATEALAVLERGLPYSSSLLDRAAGYLIFPEVHEASLALGGAHGQGVLREGKRSAGYSALTKACAGLQVGMVSYRQALIFMTDEALQTFHDSSGLSLGANMQIVTPKNATTLGHDRQAQFETVYAVLFGQPGLRAGLVLEGTCYHRLA